MKRIAIVSAGVLGLAFGAVLLVAGPLNPPVGAVSSTYKTLTEVEPRIAINATNTPGDADSLFKITQPGSYYLTGNVTGVNAKHGIEIALAQPGGAVTIDLGGFDAAGVAGSLSGIKAAPGVRVTLVGGTVRAWGEFGVDLTGVAGASLTGVRAASNTFHGIIAGDHATLTRCAASGNGLGMQVGLGSVLTECRAESNAGNGISVGNGSQVQGCASALNGAGGFVLGVGASAAECDAHDNSGAGFFLQNGASAARCTAALHNAEGFVGNDGVTLTDCQARGNGATGFRLNFDARLTSCAATANTGDGFRVFSGGLLDRCLAANNTLDGFKAGPTTPQVVVGTAIANCHATGNGGDGIEVFYQSTVRDNTCDSNTGVGIRVVNDFNTIRANLVSNNNGGIDGSAGGANVIVSNVGRNSTPNYNVNAATNVLGTIVNSEAAMNAAPNALINLSF